MLDENKNEYNGNSRSTNAITLRDGLLFFGAGATIGAAVALLFAPKSGAELRSNIADASRKGYDATLEKASDLKDQSADAIKAIKDKAATVYDFAAEKLGTGGDSLNDVVSATTGALTEGMGASHNEPQTHDPMSKPTGIM